MSKRGSSLIASGPRMNGQSKEISGLSAQLSKINKKIDEYTDALGPQKRNTIKTEDFLRNERRKLQNQADAILKKILNAAK